MRQPVGRAPNLGHAAHRTILAFLVLLALLFVPAAVSAQGSGQTTDTPALSEATSEQIESVVRAVALIDRLSDSEGVNDQTLAAARVKLDGLDRDLEALRGPLDGRISEINSRIDQIAPADGGAPEPPSVAEERVRLTNERNFLTGLVGQINDAENAVATIVERIAEKRLAAFTDALFRRTQIDRSLLQDTWKASRGETASLYVMISNWLTFVVRTKPLQFVLSTFVALVFAFGMFLAIRRMFASLLYRDPTVTQPPYFSKIVIAFWSAILPSLVFSFFLAATFWLYDYFAILSPSIRRIAAALFPALAGIFFVYNLARAILAPRYPRWQLIGVHASAAGRLLFLTTAMACIYGADSFIGNLNEIVSAPLPLTVSKSLLAALLFGAVIIAIALTRAGVSDEDGSAVGWPKWISVPLLLLGAFIIVTAMAGYIGLARFTAHQIVVTGAVLITMYIGILAGRQIGSEGLLAQSGFGRALHNRLSLQPHTIEKLGIIAGIAFIVLVLLLGTPLILLQWGSQPADIALWAGRAFSGFQIGAVRISFSGLLLGIVIFAAGVVATRLFQKWLATSVLPRSNIDSGVRDSIRTGIGYFGFALAALLGITSAGVDLSNLAIVAGALSIGIGFGLQNIVSNFVSGLILLVERPIKVGDWVETGSTAGFVKKISVRATEIETFQRQTVIVPNSDLINSVVGNWTHKYRGGRIDIAVGVAYGTDIRKVREILLEIARSNTMILKYPEPFVFFRDFGESSLDFELRFHLSDILKFPIVSTDVRFAIIDAFAENGIEIPFPQRDLHVRSGSLVKTTDGLTGGSE